MATKIIKRPKRVNVRIGDSLRIIAKRELNDINRWTELVELNNLRPPYIIASINEIDRLDKTLIWGDLIKLPIQINSSLNVLVFDENLHGSDVELSNFGKLKNTSTGDLNIVNGKLNLHQALRNRLKCRIGELYPHKSYGCNAYLYLGEKNVLLTQMYVHTTVLQALRQEPRIDTVNKIDTKTSGEILTVNAEVTSIGENTPFDLNLAYPISF